MNRTASFRVVVIDHFDSFTYNLVVAFEKLGAAVQVFRTNTSIEDVRRARPTHIVLSPGPGHPQDATLFLEALSCFKNEVPILGVCLGHQAIGLHFGARIVRCTEAIHGKTSKVTHNGTGLFENVVENPLEACRYHSLAIEGESIPPRTLLQTAWSEDGTIMGIKSEKYPHVVGVQFHPESFFTPHGQKLLANFLKLEVRAVRIEHPPEHTQVSNSRPPGFGSERTRGRRGIGWGNG